MLSNPCFYMNVVVHLSVLLLIPVRCCMKYFDLIDVFILNNRFGPFHSADCGPPPMVEYASYLNTSTLEGTTVTYTCAQYTVAEGIAQTTCLNSGKWSDMDLYCRGM